MGTLFLVSTPIGNLDDMTIRGLKTLGVVDVIACEDTRQTGQLLALLRERFATYIGSSTPRLYAYHDKNEHTATPELIAMLQHGQSIALVSDAGTPMVSDPGYRLVQAAIARDIPVVPIPGASAVFPALQLSGFAVNTFLFIGYLPEKQAHRIKLLQNLKQCEHTVVSYCAPHKLERTLTDIGQVYGMEKPLAICRELTKIHEQVWRGTVANAQTLHDVKGELVLVF